MVGIGRPSARSVNNASQRPPPHQARALALGSARVSPTEDDWLNAPVESRKVNKAGPGTGPESSSCCYITTAACKSLGLPDDCDALVTLRRFRDEVLLQTPAGRRDIQTYYATAPAIVEAIDRQPEPHAIYASIFAGTIEPALAAVHARDYHQAHRLFADLVESMQQRFPDSGTDADGHGRSAIS